MLAFVLYYLIYWSSAVSIPGDILPFVLLSCDVAGKCCSYMQVQHLPYARRMEECKVGVVYRRAGLLPMSLAVLVLIATQAVAYFPLSLFVEQGYVWLSFALPLVTSLGLISYIRRRIGGYTGDTCGAICLLSELAMLLGYTIYAQMNSLY